MTVERAESGVIRGGGDATGDAIFFAGAVMFEKGDVEDGERTDVLLVVQGKLSEH